MYYLSSTAVEFSIIKYAILHNSWHHDQ